MILSNVEDISMTNISNKKYDLAIFSCGYEDRATTICKLLNHKNLGEIVVLCFNDYKSIGSRFSNEMYFKSITDNIIEVDSESETRIYSFLNNFLSKYNGNQLNILVDYSSMSRLWYVSVLNWSKFIDIDLVSIDYAYSVGEYKEDFSPLVINEILALPGHEGVTTHSKTISIFGLGFDSLTTLCVLDKLEPSKVHSFIAIPVCGEYTNKTEIFNKEFIDNFSEPVQYYPLSSLEKSYRLMSELILPYIGEYNISFIPMGPKPHVLATAILSTKFNEVINLYVQGKRKTPPNAVSNGVFICTNVQFK